MNKSELFTQAHKMTKATLRDGDDYRITFGAAIKILMVKDSTAKPTQSIEWVRAEIARYTSKLASTGDKYRARHQRNLARSVAMLEALESSDFTQAVKEAGFDTVAAADSFCTGSIAFLRRYAPAEFSKIENIK